MASLPTDGHTLEFHLQCSRPGAFIEAARRLRLGDTLRLGPAMPSPLHYDAAWAERPLWALASGTGLAPLWGIVREALRQGHSGSIRLVHLAAPGEHYLTDDVLALAAAHANLQYEPLGAGHPLSHLRPSRPTLALACGGAKAVAEMARQLFMAGVPRNQVITETFEPLPL